MTQFWGNHTGGYLTTGLSGNQQAGVRFGLSANLTITGLGFYRSETGTGRTPTHLFLWRVSDGAQLADLSAVQDTGTVGWQWTGLPSPLTLLTGEDYIVTAHFLATYRVAYVSGNGPSTVPSPFVKPTSVGRYSTTLTFPDSQTSANAWAADVTDDTSVGPPGGDGGATPGEVNDALAEWLSSDGGTQTHETDGLPWLTKSVLDTLASSFGTVVGGLSDVANATGTAMARLRQIGQDTAALLGRIPTTITTGFDQLFSWFGTAGRPEGTDDLPTAITAIRDALDTNVDVELLRERLTLSPDLTDATRWSVVGTVEGTGPDAVALQADLYVLEVVSAGAERSTLTIGTYTWRRYLGWVAPRVHGTVLPRRQLEWDTNAVCHPPLLMDGLLIHTGPDVDWLVTAYVLDRS